MKILIITQDEPFYLFENLEYLISLLPKEVLVVGCVVNEVSPFGKKESFKDKSLKTLRIFGWKFFSYYSVKFIKRKLFQQKSVRKLLEKNNIPVIHLNENINSENSLNLIKSYTPDLLVSILGNQIFKERLINLAPKGCINLHTALLPKYRGLMPTFWVLKNKEKHTGVSVFFVDKGIDSGPIIVQKKVEIKNRTLEELIKLTKQIGMESIAEAILLIRDNKVQLIPNPSEQKSYYSFPKKEDVKEFLMIGNKFF